MALSVAANFSQGALTIHHLDEVGRAVQDGTVPFIESKALGAGTRKFRWKGTDALSNSKENIMGWVVPLNRTYIPAEDITIKVVAWRDTGTASVATLDVTAWLLDNQGSATGSDLITTAATTITTSAVEYSFTLDGATLTIGDVILIDFETNITETAAANLAAWFASPWMECTRLGGL